MVTNPRRCNLDRVKYLGGVRQRPPGDDPRGPLASGRLHDDDVVRRYEVQGRTNAFVEQVRVDMLRPEVGNPEVQCCTLRPYRLEIGGGRADLAVQAQPRLKPALALDQMVRKIPGQRDAN